MERRKEERMTEERRMEKRRTEEQASRTEENVKLSFNTKRTQGTKAK